MKKLFILLFSLFLAFSSFSQITAIDSIVTDKYPFVMIYKGDTTFVLLKEQFVKVNRGINKGLEYKKLNRILKDKEAFYIQEIDKFKEVDSVLNDKLDLKDKIISNKNGIIAIDKSIMLLQEDEIKKLKRHRLYITGGSIIIIVLLLL